MALVLWRQAAAVGKVAINEVAEVASRIGLIGLTGLNTLILTRGLTLILLNGTC